MVRSVSPPHPSDAEIGRVLAALRRARRIELAQLCDGLGFDAIMMERVESGAQPLLARELLWLMEMLGSPLSIESFTGADDARS